MAALCRGEQFPFSLALCWALRAVVLIGPWVVLAPGFWLSFSAFAMLGYAGSNRLERPGWLRKVAYEKWVVTLGLTPLLLVLLQQVYIVSPLANAFAIPLISLIVTPLALLIAVLPVEFILHDAHAVMACCMWLLRACADLPVAV